MSMTDALVSNKPRLFTSRFTNETWEQNKAYKARLGWRGALYGAPRRVKVSLPLGRYMFVLEMNNDTNQTLGVGLVRNNVVCEKKFRIYSEGNYNRYIYRGKYRIKEEMMKHVHYYTLFSREKQCKLTEGRNVNG